MIEVDAGIGISACSGICYGSLFTKNEENKDLYGDATE